MAVTENGKAVEGEKQRPNGHAIGHTTSVARRRVSPEQSWTSWLANTIARLSIWYAIIAIIFWCPSNSADLSQTSPGICKPYISTKNYLQPHLQPFYDQYASEYVEKIRPYAEKANTYVVSPLARTATVNYHKFAAPQVEKVKAYGQSEWDRLLMPQVRLAQERASVLYTNNLAQHVDKASAIASPYYEAAKDNAVNVHQQHILPALDSSRPHLKTAYVATQKFMVDTAWPLAQQVWTKVIIFVDGTLWPFVKGVYSDNVRPQLVMISERIATYQEGRKLQSAMEEVDTSAKPGESTVNGAQTSSAGTGGTPTIVESATSFMSSILEEASSSVMPKPTGETQIATDESVEDDLVKWQKKFTLAAERGTDDLRARVQEILDSLVKSDIDGEGKGIANALQKTTEVEIEKVKSKTKKAVESLQDDATTADEEAAEGQIVTAVREAGLEIKELAIKLRDWAHNFEAEVSQRTNLAAESTLHVLDSIRDLGLQEIGMRWAWMDGITYKHWAKYHDLKQRFDEWRMQVREVAIKHPVATEAKESAQQILEEGMAVTEDAAKELVRLKEVAKWKIRARDATDDFETRIMPAAAVSAASKLAADFQDATSSLTGTTQGTMESLASQATNSASSLSDAASSAISDPASKIQSVMSDVLGTASDVASAASDSISEAGLSAESIANVASASASSAMLNPSPSGVKSFASAVSESLSSAVAGSSTGSLESIASSVSSLGHDAYNSVSSSVESRIGSSDKILEHSYVSSASDMAASINAAAEEYLEPISDSAASVVSSASSKVFAGAMAQAVKGQIPIFDDVFDDDTKSSFSEKIQSMANEAGDQYSEVTNALSEAIYGPSQGSVERLTSLAGEQYLSALSAASSVFYGMPTPAAESLANMVTDRYKEAVAAASSVLHAATYTPLPESVMQQASSVYSDAVSRAQSYQSAAAEVISKQFAKDPQPIYSQMLESISSAYDSSVSVASNGLHEALSAGSEQYLSLSSAASAAVPTQNQMESISSVASSRLKDALDAANAQYHSLKVAAGAEPAPASLQAQQAYYAAIGYAYEQYNNFVTAGSSAVYGAPTPAYQSLISQASSQYSIVSVAASSSLDAYLSSIGSVASKATKTQSPAQSLLSQASASYSSVLSVASVSLLSASEAASKAVLGTPAPAYQQVLTSASSQYAAATALAAANLENLLNSASSAVGKKQKSPAQSVLDSISAQYNDAVFAASSQLAAASSSASSALYGPADGSFESIANVASSNWEDLIAAASSNIYGKPTPVWASVTSQALDYSAQATDAAAEKYVVISAYISEIIVGREPDFTESVMSRFSSVYYTGVMASASSLASEAYASGSSIASSVSSAAATYFTTPPEVDSILEAINSQLDAAVEAASLQVYGSSKGPVEQATSAAAEAYSSASSAAIEAVYGAPAGYGEAMSSSIADAAQSASNAISAAIFGTPTGSVEAATSAAANTYSSVSSVVSDSLSSMAEQAGSMANAAQAKVSEAIFGPEQSAMESAQEKVIEAVASARSRLSELGIQASVNVESIASVVSGTVASAASQVSQSVSSATSRVKDEL